MNSVIYLIGLVVIVLAIMSGTLAATACSRSAIELCQTMPSNEGVVSKL